MERLFQVKFAGLPQPRFLSFILCLLARARLNSASTRGSSADLQACGPTDHPPRPWHHQLETKLSSHAHATLAGMQMLERNLRQMREQGQGAPLSLLPPPPPALSAAHTSRALHTSTSVLPQSHFGALSVGKGREEPTGTCLRQAPAAAAAHPPLSAASPASCAQQTTSFSSC